MGGPFSDLFQSEEGDGMELKGGMAVGRGAGGAGRGMLLRLQFFFRFCVDGFGIIVPKGSRREYRFATTCGRLSESSVCLHFLFCCVFFFFFFCFIRVIFICPLRAPIPPPPSTSVPSFCCC